MGLLKQTQQQYYDVKKSFTGDGTTAIFTVSNSSDTFPTSYNSSNAKVYVDNNLILNTTYSFSFSATSSDFFFIVWQPDSKSNVINGIKIILDFIILL